MTCPKLLGQSAPNAATLTALYTAPGCACTTIDTLTICNRSAVATAFRIPFLPMASPTPLPITSSTIPPSLEMAPSISPTETSASPKQTHSASTPPPQPSASAPYGVGRNANYFQPSAESPKIGP